MDPCAIVVLGARVLPDGRLSGALQRRVLRAAQAYHQQQPNLVVCSGGKRWNGHVEADRMRQGLVEQGVPDHVIVGEVLSRSTVENARCTQKILRERGVTVAYLVTCPWHLKRAANDFRMCGLHVVPIPTDEPQAGMGLRKWRDCKERVCTWIDRARLRAAALRDFTRSVAG